MMRADNVRHNIGYGTVLVSILAFCCYLVQAHCVPDDKPHIEQCTSCLLSNKSTYSCLMNYVFSFVSDLLHKSKCNNMTPATTTPKITETTVSSTPTQRGNTNYCYSECATTNPTTTENVCENCI